MLQGKGQEQLPSHLPYPIDTIEPETLVQTDDIARWIWSLAQEALIKINSFTFQD